MIDFQIQKATESLGLLRAALADAEAVPPGTVLRSEHIRVAREAVAYGERHLAGLVRSRADQQQRADAVASLAAATATHRSLT